ncbi:hypothetical protein Ae201684P_015447 [Aphanomyces euteiches]|uniref:DDE-1 domain-containing protein n=1 Tax=Aphanomyces euteiches TaxID=100861 RepID=A0A6G0WQX2_9STRA|nr:hypothetical protein Ae201684_012673 [Aphanomyces euteiches]KAH9095646.1 hypothetical protein Ae201684P_015447 [Aphanomyces euteiches]
MRCQTRCGNKSSEEGDATLKAFSDKILKLVEENEIEEIYNADQTAINYEYLGRKTVNAVGEKRVWIRTSGHEKQRATAMLLANSKGEIFFLFIVLKTTKCSVEKNVQENIDQRNGFGKVVWKEICKIQDKFTAQLYGNPTAWWNSAISCEFINYHFGNRKGKNVKPILLIWDDFAPHFCPKVIGLAASLNVMLEKVPPGFAWMCQPADVAWIKPFKTMMRKNWI